MQSPLMLAESLFAEQIQPNLIHSVVNGAGIRKRNPNFINHSVKVP